MAGLTRRRFIRRSTAVVAVAAWNPLRLLQGPGRTANQLSGEMHLPEGFTVPAGQVWEFDPQRSTTVVVRGNVVVRGTLRMRPASANVIHTLRFVDVKETHFVGGGMEVIDEDVGLWIMGSGRLDARGTTKVAWNRIGDDASWGAHDELRVAPVAAEAMGQQGFPEFDAGSSVPEFTRSFLSANALSFIDTSQSVHRNSIEAIYAAGITKGTSPTTFSPDDSVTRGQMAAFLVRALGLRRAGSADFADTRGHIFERDIEALFAAGITKGTSPTTFSPDDSVTRGQMASFLARALHLEPPPLRRATLKYAAEVLNLTRNVRIQGTESGRAHIFIHSTEPQGIRYVEISHMGPRRRGSDGFTENVLGRYGLHFHHCGSGSRGSLVQGVVVRDCGGHAFVPHMSHGITMRECISYNTYDDAFWWDAGDLSNDIVWDRCVAALVRVDPEFRGFRLTGFNLGRGGGNSVTNSVAVGVLGNGDASGFHWPEHANSGPNVWTFEDNLAHNCAGHGIFVWQNTDTRPHNVDRFDAYRCGGFGISQGAYVSPYYHYREGNLIDNSGGGVQQLALNGDSRPDRPDAYAMSYEGLSVVGGAHGFRSGHHRLPNASVPVLLKDCTFADQAGAVVRLDDEGDPGEFDFVNCAIDVSDIAVGQAVADTRVRIQNSQAGAFGVDGSGRVTPIPAFYR